MEVPLNRKIIFLKENINERWRWGGGDSGYEGIDYHDYARSPRNTSKLSDQLIDIGDKTVSILLGFAIDIFVFTFFKFITYKVDKEFFSYDSKFRDDFLTSFDWQQASLDRKSDDAKKWRMYTKMSDATKSMGLDVEKENFAFITDKKKFFSRRKYRQFYDDFSQDARKEFSQAIKEVAIGRNPRPIRTLVSRIQGVNPEFDYLYSQLNPSEKDELEKIYYKQFSYLSSLGRSNKRQIEKDVALIKKDTEKKLR